ncbi:hotdog fold thioesterase [Herpetosiphon gulosus]|uniref:Esterase PA1618 n=1 Tax=Herpetosiphon gulosus TaxID=1973496 RepID=A0ABP9WXA3_9CHLR
MNDLPDVSAMNEFQRGTLADTLGISFTEVSLDRVVATMPVERKVHQPFGLLHGGASVVLAESLASVAGWANVMHNNQLVVGVEINANHLRSVRNGVVTGVATPLHRGRRTQVWEVRISDEQDRLICVSRCTVAVVDAEA